MMDEVAVKKRVPWQPSAKETLLALYLFVSIALSLACYFEDDAYFKLVGPISIGLTSGYLYGKCFQSSRPVWRFFKVLGLSILVYFAAIVTGGIVAAILRGPQAFHA